MDLVLLFAFDFTVIIDYSLSLSKMLEKLMESIKKEGILYNKFMY